MSATFESLATPRPGPMASLLRARWTYHFGVARLTFIYWGSGLDKLIHFGAAVEEMAHFKLNPPAVFAVATIVTQLIGSALLIKGGRLAWLGAGALVVFTLATIPIAHDFWNLQGQVAFLEKMTVFEHITVCGGLVVAALLAEVRRPRA